MRATSHETMAGQRRVTAAGARRLPRRMLLGLALIAVVWPVAWLRLRPVSDYTFFPLWLGYVLTMDGVVWLRTGSSPIARAGRRAAWLFAASVPLWWIFELLNSAVENWHYHTPVDYGPLAYGLLASLAFSTVLPAVLTTTELTRSFGWSPLRRLPALRFGAGVLLACHLAGWLMLALLVVAPRYAFPLVWLSLIFLLDPVVDWLGGRSVASYLRRGDWSLVWNLGLATLICGWFWEMWNFYALPKWSYSVPFVDFWHVWEMPVLGYGGYIPFGIEVFVFYQLVVRLLVRRRLPQTRVANDDDAWISASCRAGAGRARSAGRRRSG